MVCRLRPRIRSALWIRPLAEASNAAYNDRMRLFRPVLRTTALALILVMLTPVVSRADDIYTIVVKKQEEKAKTRWNISDWLETRDKMRLMDLWLAIHSPAPYEFFLSGAYL